jgi:hypothetical protein
MPGAQALQGPSYLIHDILQQQPPGGLIASFDDRGLWHRLPVYSLHVTPNSMVSEDSPLCVILSPLAPDRVNFAQGSSCSFGRRVFNKC